MSLLATQGELRKLGQTLELEPRELEFLAGVPAEQLRALRISIYELLYRDDRDLFRRAAAVVRRLPASVLARLALRGGPFMAARLAAEVPSRVALGVVLRVPLPFLVDCLAYLDPRRTRDVIRLLPVELVVAAGRELVVRADHMTMSRFVDFLSDEAIRAVEEAIEDEGDLVRVTFYMGSKTRVDHLFGMLPPERLERLIVRVEERSEELLPAFLSLMVHASYALKRRLGDLVAAQDEPVLSGFVHAAHEQGMWADVLPAVAVMSETARARVVNLPILREPDVQRSIIKAANENGLWGILLPMIALMDDANRDAVAGIVAAGGATTLANAADAALLGERWPTLIDLVRRLPPAQQEEFQAIARRYGEVDPELSERITRLGL